MRLSRARDSPQELDQVWVQVNVVVGVAQGGAVGDHLDPGFCVGTPLLGPQSDLVQLGNTGGPVRCYSQGPYEAVVMCTSWDSAIVIKVIDNVYLL